MWPSHFRFFNHSSGHAFPFPIKREKLRVHLLATLIDITMLFSCWISLFLKIVHNYRKLIFAHTYCTPNSTLLNAHRNITMRIRSELSQFLLLHNFLSQNSGRAIVCNAKKQKIWLLLGQLLWYFNTQNIHFILYDDQLKRSSGDC